MPLWQVDSADTLPLQLASGPARFRRHDELEQRSFLRLHPHQHRLLVCKGSARLHRASRSNAP